MPSARTITLLALAAALTAPCSGAAAAGLSTELLATVVANLAASATMSWELGTRSQALLELNAPAYSVLTPSAPLPPPASAPASLAPVLALAHTVVANRSASNGGVVGPQPLLNDSAAGDPASLGMCVLLANWTGAGGGDGLDYAGAAADQLAFLYSAKVPRTSDGAISHRTDQLQLWSDSVYMVPPFLAYYGALTANQTLLQMAYTQISLYRSYLLDTNAGGLWTHIALGAGADPGHWSTGNGWAAAGMLRVLGTILNTPFAAAMKSETNDLVQWVGEIHAGMYAHLDGTGVFMNYPDLPPAPPDPAAGTGGNFYDAASTALLAAGVYRLSLLAGVHTHIPQAEASRAALYLTAANGTQAHFSATGFLEPVVNPYDYPFELALSAGGGSPEGEAFVLQLDAAWRDWAAAGSKGVNGGRGNATAPRAWVVVAVAVGAGAVGWWALGA
ncbi:hypothetical protein HWV62_33081 [Athelia sp. TMB]|nr:hypothetical protein HWV62_33081 [Athelia sp. TMB]